MDVCIGTAGYAYPAWVGGFYPAGTPAVEQLGYYASQFPAVEINSSFHRPPTVEQVGRMRSRVPPGFRFALKVPRSASHDGRTEELPAFAAAAAALGEQLLGLVVQFPETFRNDRMNRDRLTLIRQSLADFPLAVEFRHVSWDVPGLPKWLAERKLTCVSVGVPDLPTLFPSGLRLFGERVYARLHGRNPVAWYAGHLARYDYDYPDADLRALADELTTVDGVREAAVFFNNCVGVQATSLDTGDHPRRFDDTLRAGVLTSPPGVPNAIHNARRFMEALRGRAGVRLVQPTTRPLPASLFDDIP